MKSRLAEIQKVNAYVTNIRRFCKIGSGLCTADLWSIFYKCNRLIVSRKTGNVLSVCSAESMK